MRLSLPSQGPRTDLPIRRRPVPSTPLHSHPVSPCQEANETLPGPTARSAATGVSLRNSVHLAVGATLATGLGAMGVFLMSTAGLALPGAVVGLGLLALLLRFSPRAADGAEALFDRISPHMVLFFVPAGSGIVANADALMDDWLVLVLVVLLGTPAALAAVALAASAVLGRRSKSGEDVSP